jgi:hypothetical protein
MAMLFLLLINFKSKKSFKEYVILAPIYVSSLSLSELASRVNSNLLTSTFLVKSLSLVVVKLAVVDVAKFSVFIFSNIL